MRLLIIERSVCLGWGGGHGALLLCFGLSIIKQQVKAILLWWPPIGKIAAHLAYVFMVKVPDC